jgi:hypothetical protein
MKIIRDTILANEKYMVDVIVLKSYTEEYQEIKRRLNTGQKTLYQALDIAPAIITKDQFQQVAAEKERRSNITRTDAGRIRKSMHNSMKRQKLSRLIKQKQCRFLIELHSISETANPLFCRYQTQAAFPLYPETFSEIRLNC